MQGSQTEYKESVEAIDRLIEKAKPQTSTKMKSAVVALFTADTENPLRYSGVIGMLHLDNDRLLKSKFLRLYDLQSLIMLFQVELYYGFDENYRMIEDNLYIFDFLVDGIIGFQFFSTQDANIMCIKIKSIAPKMEEYREVQKMNNQQQNKERKQNSFFGGMKKRMKGLFHHQQEQQPRQQQSQILSIKKTKSIKFDTSTGAFNIENIPPQWAQIFAAMNIKKQDLQDKQVAKLIIQETIIHQTRKEMIENQSGELKLHLDAIEGEDKIMENDKIRDTLPVPPKDLPLPPLLLSPARYSVDKNGRTDLMDEIRSNNIKLRPVTTTEKGYQIDASSMNREERMDLAEHLRVKLKKRKEALNRRKSEEQDSD